jgi:hypothetical protein
VTRIGRGEVYTGFWWRNVKEGITWKKPGVDWRIILKLVFKKWDGAWTVLIWLRVGAGSYECGNEPLGFIKLGNFLIS